MVRSHGIGEVYRDGEGEITVVDENGDVKPTDDFSAELDLSDDTNTGEQEFDEESYIREIHGNEIRAIADIAIGSVGETLSKSSYGLDLSTDEDRLTYAAALKLAIADRQAEIDAIAATPEYQREEQVYGPYNDNSPIEYDSGPLHDQAWNMTLKLLPLKHELAQLEKGK